MCPGKVSNSKDIRSLRELITYGIKGMAVYAEHASRLGHEDNAIYAFMQLALVAITDDALLAYELIKLVLEIGTYGVKVMALLDNANTSAYGNPGITRVNIGVRSHPSLSADMI